LLLSDIWLFIVLFACCSLLLLFFCFFFFFFSSRRRHTISYGDWSSDVCSSDLAQGAFRARRNAPCAPVAGDEARVCARDSTTPRSEERRVGKECRYRWAKKHQKKKEKRQHRMDDKKKSIKHKIQNTERHKRSTN